MGPPDGFGTSEVSWQPDPSHPVDRVAALWLQHRVVLAADGARPGLSLRERARLVGISKTQLGRMLSGHRVMNLDELLPFGRAHRLNLAALLGPDQPLLPPEYKHLIIGFDPDGMPRLGPDDAVSAFARIVDDLCGWWRNEARASRESLLSAPVLLHRAVVLADSPHAPAAAATLLGGSKQGARATYAVRAPTGFRLVFLPDLEAGSPDQGSALVLTWLLDPPLLDWDSEKSEPIVLLAGPLAAAQVGLHGGSLAQGARLLFRGHDLRPTQAEPPDDGAYRVVALVQHDQYTGLLLVRD